MHRWKIESRNIWLCNACMRELTHVIMLGTWKWLDENQDAALCCDRCKCTDQTVDRFGRLRWVLRFFVQHPPRQTAKLKAYRRAL